MHQIDAMDAVMHWMKSHYFGKYAGKIVDTNDPLKKGRLKVSMPDVFGTDVAVWAMPCVPYAGAGVGFKALPEVDANVWIEFEKGDPSYPVWTGFFWGDNDMPEESGDGDTVKLWKTKSITIQIDDDAGEIVITANEGITLTMSSDIVAKAESSSNPTSTAKLTIALGSISADVTKKIEVTSTSVNVNSGALEVK